MQLSDWTFLSLLLGLLLVTLLSMLLVMILLRQLQTPTKLMQRLLMEERSRVQGLLNQLRSTSPQELASLEHLTRPEKKETFPSFDEDAAIAEAIDYEEQLARQGFTMGDVDEYFAGQGWNRSPVKPSADGSPTIFEQ